MCHDGINIEKVGEIGQRNDPMNQAHECAADRIVEVQVRQLVVDVAVKNDDVVCATGFRSILLTRRVVPRPLALASNDAAKVDGVGQIKKVPRKGEMPAWHLTLARHFLYLADAINLRRVIACERKRSRHNPSSQQDGAESCGANDVIILDRYIYDELSNLNLDNPISRAFVRLIHRIVPLPDLAYLLDVDPVVAHARKPEYPVDFMRQCRQSYFALAALVRTITVIPPRGLREATQAVLKAAKRRLAASGRRVELLSEDSPAA